MTPVSGPAGVVAVNDEAVNEAPSMFWLKVAEIKLLVGTEVARLAGKMPMIFGATVLTGPGLLLPPHPDERRMAAARSSMPPLIDLILICRSRGNAIPDR